MRSPQTIGEDDPRPGISTFHRMLVDSLHWSGGSAFVAMPLACGPRHAGQLRSRSTAAVWACSDTRPTSRPPAAKIGVLISIDTLAPLYESQRRSFLGL